MHVHVRLWAVSVQIFNEFANKIHQTLPQAKKTGCIDTLQCGLLKILERHCYFIAASQQFAQLRLYVRMSVRVNVAMCVSVMWVEGLTGNEQTGASDVVDGCVLPAMSAYALSAP